jgi:hypothetical protein
MGVLQRRPDSCVWDDGAGGTGLSRPSIRSSRCTPCCGRCIYSTARVAIVTNTKVQATLLEGCATANTSRRSGCRLKPVRRGICEQLGAGAPLCACAQFFLPITPAGGSARAAGSPDQRAQRSRSPERNRSLPSPQSDRIYRRMFGNAQNLRGQLVLMEGLLKEIDHAARLAEQVLLAKLGADARPRTWSSASTRKSLPPVWPADLEKLVPVEYSLRIRSARRLHAHPP